MSKIEYIILKFSLNDKYFSLFRIMVLPLHCLQREVEDNLVLSNTVG